LLVIIFKFYNKGIFLTRLTDTIQANSGTLGNGGCTYSLDHKHNLTHQLFFIFYITAPETIEQKRFHIIKAVES